MEDKFPNNIIILHLSIEVIHYSRAFFIAARANNLVESKIGMGQLLGSTSSGISVHPRTVASQLFLSNFLGVLTIQKSFTVGQASNLVPIQQVPNLLAPIIIYFLIFLLIPPNIFSGYYLIIGIILIIISSFLLGKRSAQIEQIK